VGSCDVARGRRRRSRRRRGRARRRRGRRKCFGCPQWRRAPSPRPSE